MPLFPPSEDWKITVTSLLDNEESVNCVNPNNALKPAAAFTFGSVEDNSPDNTLCPDVVYISSLGISSKLNPKIPSNASNSIAKISFFPSNFQIG